MIPLPPSINTTNQLPESLDSPFLAIIRPDKKLEFICYYGLKRCVQQMCWNTSKRFDMMIVYFEPRKNPKLDWLHIVNFAKSASGVRAFRRRLTFDSFDEMIDFTRITSRYLLKTWGIEPGPLRQRTLKETAAIELVTRVNETRTTRYIGYIY